MSAVPQPVKFGRTYTLIVQPDEDAAAAAGNPDASPIKITLPLTLEFDVTRNIQTSANTCQIRIWNLGMRTRNQIRFDRTNYAVDRGVVLQAGYGLNQAVIFAGNISQAWSVREGVNFITTIECFVGGSAFVNARTDRTYTAGTTYQQIIQDLVSSLNEFGVSIGAIGSFPGSIPRDQSFSGNTIEILRQLTGGGMFIDNLKANCLNNGEYINNLTGITLVNSDSGLLGTPVQEFNILNFDMIFEPRMNPGQAVNLQSQTANNFNGVRKCISVKHRGMISAAQCGSAITSVGLQYIKNLTPVASQNPAAPVIA